MDCKEKIMERIKAKSLRLLLFFLGLILSFTVFLGSFAACVPAAYELNVMSFNIRWPTGVDTGFTDWTYRKEAVVEFLNDSRADVIGLQEIHTKKDQLSYIQENLANKYELIYFGDNETNAIIYNKKVFNLISQEQYWLSETPDVSSIGWNGNCYLAAGILMLEHKATGDTVRVINTHGALDDDTNVKGFELIAERSLSGENDPFTVMLGDFNATPNKLGYVPIAEKLQDCRVSAKESPNRDHNTYNGWGKYPDDELGKRIIDYCFVSKRENVEVLTYKVRADKWGDGHYISDHYAVQATIKIYNNTENKEKI